MNNPAAMPLSPALQSHLLIFARQSLLYFLETGQPEAIDLAKLHGAFQRPMATFVTLRGPQGLRGCIGNTVPQGSLAESVRDNIISAASGDPRFPPVALNEACALHIEISILLPGPDGHTPFIPVHDLDEIVVGRDGLRLRPQSGGRGGLLLPQVPEAHGMNRDQFLEALCTKAGAPPGAWTQAEYRLDRFLAQVFGEG